MIELEGLPELVDPVLIAAFEGWNDAGEASSGAIAHLEAEWKATELASFDPEDYYDFQVTRPIVEVGEGLTRSITWPTTRLYVARPPGADRDVILLRGIEPNMRWRSFCAEIIELCQKLGVELAVLLGALLNDSPHTRPVPIVGSASDENLARAINLELSRYEGRPASSACCSRPSARRTSPRSRCGPRCRTTWPSRPAPRRRWRC
nr:hypothetical protein GCM10020093_027000 [Planobispora longispora]